MTTPRTLTLDPPSSLLSKPSIFAYKPGDGLDSSTAVTNGTKPVLSPVLPPPSDEAYYLLESQMNTVESAIKWGLIRSPDGQLYRDLYAWLLAVEAGEWVP